MKTSKILLSGVAAIAAGFAFAIPGITPTPVEPECPYNTSEVVLETMPWWKTGIEHADNYTIPTYIAIVDGDDVVYLDNNGKGVELEKANVMSLITNSTYNEFQIKNSAGKYLNTAKATVRETEHVHTKNPVDNTWCCGATAETMPGETTDYTIIDFGTNKDKHVTFGGNAADNYYLAFDGKTISASVYDGLAADGNDYTTGDDAKMGKYLFNGDYEQVVGFVTKDQIDFLKEAKEAIAEHWQDTYQDPSVNPYYELLMDCATTTTDADTDFRTLLATLRDLVAKQGNAELVLTAQAEAWEYVNGLKYQGQDYTAIKSLVWSVTADTDAAEFGTALEELKIAQAHAEEVFTYEMIDSAYNKQNFQIVILAKDAELLNVDLSGVDAANFVVSAPRVIGVGDTDEDGCEITTVAYTVRRADKTIGEGIYTANLDATVGNYGVTPVYESLPVKGYDQQIRWTVGSTLFNTDYDLVDGLLFFRPGTKSLYFSTVGYNPILTGCKPKAVLTMDAGLKDFSISEPEFVETVGDFTYWKIDVSYLPTNVIDYAAVNLDNTFVTVYLPYLDLREIEWPKTAGMPVKGCTFDVIASESPVNFPWYGSNGNKESKKIDLSYEKFSGYLLYDQVFVASNTPAYQVVFTDVLPMDAPAYNYFKGAGTQSITITANPLVELGVEEGVISVYGVRHGKVLDKIVDIPVTTTHPSVDYTANWESKNFDLATETLTLGGDVKENYMDEVEIVVDDLVNYYNAIKDLKVQTNNDQFVVSQTSRFVPGEGKYYATINVKYVPCEAHETVEGMLYVQIAGVPDGLLQIKLIGQAGDEATVAAVKGSSAGINAVAADKANAVRYNVAGQRVNNANGIVIENGKKYVK